MTPINETYKNCSACDMELAERHGAVLIGLSETYLPVGTFRNEPFYVTGPCMGQHPYHDFISRSRGRRTASFLRGKIQWLYLCVNKSRVILPAGRFVVLFHTLSATLLAMVHPSKLAIFHDCTKVPSKQNLKRGAHLIIVHGGCQGA